MSRSADGRVPGAPSEAARPLLLQGQDYLFRSPPKCLDFQEQVHRLGMVDEGDGNPQPCVLVLARADKSLGPRLRRSQFTSETLRQQDAKLSRENPATFKPLECGLASGRRLGDCGTTMATLATRLPIYVGRIAVDRTGLTGLYQYDLRFSDQPIPGAGPGGGFPFPVSSPGGDPEAPTLFTALEEQLGLKLVPQTAPVDVLVIDHVEPPKPN